MSLPVLSLSVLDKCSCMKWLWKPPSSVTAESAVNGRREFFIFPLVLHLTYGKRLQHKKKAAVDKTHGQEPEGGPGGAGGSSGLWLAAVMLSLCSRSLTFLKSVFHTCRCRGATAVWLEFSFTLNYLRKILTLFSQIMCGLYLFYSQS